MKYVYGTCVVVGLLLTIGFAGGCDCGNLTFGQAVLYTIGSLIVTLYGAAGLKGAE